MARWQQRKKQKQKRESRPSKLWSFTHGGGTEPHLIECDSCTSKWEGKGPPFCSCGGQLAHYV